MSPKQWTDTIVNSDKTPFFKGNEIFQNIFLTCTAFFIWICDYSPLIYKKMCCMWYLPLELDASNALPLALKKNPF